jgi:site-specific DNA-methyltransferase (adenine-specific)
MNVQRFYDNRITLIHGDCFEVMPQIRANIIAMTFADFPYGTTQNRWDTPIDLKAFWSNARRINRSNAAYVFTAQIPFNITLGASNIASLKYEWIWRKERGTGHLNAKIQPQKDHENIMIFYDAQPTYNPQMREGKPYIAKKGGLSSNYRKDSKDNIVTVNNGERYPLTVIDFPRDSSKLHPTQKPVELLEYLIKTYTDEDDLVFDPTMGSATTALACMNTKRRFIGIELYPLLDRPIDPKTNPNYFGIAIQRVTGDLA